MATRTRRFPPVLVGALVVLGTAGCAGAPGAAQQAFEQRYPGFEVVSWEQQPYGWEAAFGDDGVYEA